MSFFVLASRSASNTFVSAAYVLIELREPNRELSPSIKGKHSTNVTAAKSNSTKDALPLAVPGESAGSLIRKQLKLPHHDSIGSTSIGVEDGSCCESESRSSVSLAQEALAFAMQECRRGSAFRFVQDASEQALSQERLTRSSTAP